MGAAVLFSGDSSHGDKRGRAGGQGGGVGGLDVVWKHKHR